MKTKPLENGKKYLLTFKEDSAQLIWPITYIKGEFTVFVGDGPWHFNGNTYDTKTVKGIKDITRELWKTDDIIDVIDMFGFGPFPIDPRAIESAEII